MTFIPPESSTRRIGFTLITEMPLLIISRTYLTDILPILCIKYLETHATRRNKMNFGTKLSIVYDAFKNIYMRPDTTEPQVTDLADDGYSISATFQENSDTVNVGVERFAPNKYVVYRFKPSGEIPEIVSPQITGLSARLCYLMARHNFKSRRQRT